MDGISKRVISITIKITQRYSIKVIQVYAPTKNSEDEEVYNLYEEITQALTTHKTHYNLIIGDFNAKIGKRERDETSIGNYGYGERNDRGDVLVDYLEEHRLYATNTFFKKNPKRKWIWISPDGKIKNEIDFVISSQKEIIQDVSVINRFTTGSDHRLVRSKITINHKLERTKLTKQTNPKIDTDALRKNRGDYQRELNRQLWYSKIRDSNSIESMCTKITNSMKNAGLKVAKKENKQSSSRISTHTKHLMNQRKEIVKNGDRTSEQYRDINKSIRQNIKEDLKRHNDKLIEITIENNSNLKMLRRKMVENKKQLYIIQDENGNVTTDRNKIKDIIENFYSQLYTSQLQINSEVIQKTQERKILIVGLEEIPEVITEEIKTAVREMKYRRAPGDDDIIPELIKLGNDKLIEYIRQLIDKCIFEKRIPDEWNNASVVLIYKKGNKTDLKNYRPISLLTHLYKILTKVLNRLTNKLDFYQPPEQAGFRKSFSTMDHLQTIRSLIEKTTEYNMTIYIAFIDYEKAFDSLEIEAMIEA